jgi:hypothetical protein
MGNILQDLFGKAADAVQDAPVPGVRQDTEHLTPRIEHAAGDNLPYRGSVNHGVAQDAVEMADERKHWNGRPVEFVKPPEDADDMTPIPVVVMESIRLAKRRQSSNIESAQAAVGLVRGPLVSPFWQDCTAVITASGGDIFVGGEGVTTTNGYRIPDGATLTINLHDTLYAIANANVTAYLLMAHVSGDID